MTWRPAIGFENLVTILICAVLIAPFFVFTDIPFYDLPNHIAREHVLFDPALAFTRDFYVPHWRLVPNLAIDVVVYALHFVMPVGWAIRVFLAITAAQFFLGAVFLNRVLVGYDRRFGLCAALFVFNGPFMLGLVNVSFGVGMSLWVFALWVRYGERRYSWPVFALLSSLILIAHLFAFAIYALVVAGYAATRGRQTSWTAMLRSVAHLVFPVGLYLMAMPSALNGHQAEHLWSWPRKLLAVVTVAGPNNFQFDMSCLILIGCGFILIRRQLTFSRTMILSLAGLGAVFLALPNQIDQVALVDYRIPSAFVLFFIASLGWNGSDRLRRCADIAVIAMLLVRMTVLCGEWANWQPIYQAYRTAFRSMPAGARLLTLGESPWGINTAERPPLAHVDALAVIERGTFIPTMFADQPHEILTYAPTSRPLLTDSPTSADLGLFDYVLIVHPGRTPRPDGLIDVAHGPDFVLTQVASRK